MKGRSISTIFCGVCTRVVTMNIQPTENNNRILAELASRIRKIRIAAPYTQEELAARAGISASTMRRIEAGDDVKIGNILNVLRALGILENLNLLVPAQDLKPTEMLDGVKSRRRAPKKRVLHTDAGWKWKDEE